MRNLAGDDHCDASIRDELSWETVASLPGEYEQFYDEAWRAVWIVGLLLLSLLWMATQ